MSRTFGATGAQAHRRRKSLRLEVLELRRLLSVNAGAAVLLGSELEAVAVEAAPLDVPGPTHPATAPTAGTTAQALDNEVADGVFAVRNGVAKDASETITPDPGGLAVRVQTVPPDNEIDPIAQCPGLDPRFCLPQELGLRKLQSVLTPSRGDAYQRSGAYSVGWRQLRVGPDRDGLRQVYLP